MSSGIDAARFFDSFAGSFDTLYDSKRNRLMQWVDRRFRSDMFLRFALSFEAVGDLRGRSVLDIGCGRGLLAVAAARRAASGAAIGVDICHRSAWR